MSVTRRTWFESKFSKICQFKHVIWFTKINYAFKKVKVIWRLQKLNFDFGWNKFCFVVFHFYFLKILDISLENSNFKLTNWQIDNYLQVALFIDDLNVLDGNNSNDLSKRPILKELIEYLKNSCQIQNPFRIGKSIEPRTLVGKDTQEMRWILQIHI